MLKFEEQAASQPMWPIQSDRNAVPTDKKLNNTPGLTPADSTIRKLRMCYKPYDKKALCNCGGL